MYRSIVQQDVRDPDTGERWTIQPGDQVDPNHLRVQPVETALAMGIIELVSVEASDG